MKAIRLVQRLELHSLGRGAIVCGPERSFDQDPMFALRLLADIGLRALSSAINDPATAMETIDATEDLLWAAISASASAPASREGRGQACCLPVKRAPPQPSPVPDEAATRVDPSS